MFIKKFNLIISVLFCSILFLFAPQLAKYSFADPFIIKFATLAPDGSTWMNVIRELNKEIQEKSNNRLKFKIYPGGVSGDEKDVIRKIRIGQLHSGGFSGVSKRISADIFNFSKPL